mmetsp:Transcript_24269/g.69806  ORF Transcript_24269/g.69806 Transcript_24269/m.69806 type:complete len:110 (+) Transcript_24269:460-789(+)
MQRDPKKSNFADATLEKRKDRSAGSGCRQRRARQNGGPSKAEENGPLLYTKIVAMNNDTKVEFIRFYDSFGSSCSCCHARLHGIMHALAARDLEKASHLFDCRFEAICF